MIANDNKEKQTNYSKIWQLSYTGNIYMAVRLITHAFLCCLLTDRSDKWRLSRNAKSTESEKALSCALSLYTAELCCILEFVLAFKTLQQETMNSPWA